jgi:hypothetical protein
MQLQRQEIDQFLWRRFVCEQVRFQESGVTQVAALFQDGYDVHGTDESD